MELRIADRVETLADLLVDTLAVPAEDPFRPEWVAVPSIGMRRWLAQRLARSLGTSERTGDGVAANITMPFPDELRRVVLAAELAARVDAGLLDPSVPGDPWEPERLLWPVLEVLRDPSTRERPALGPLLDLPAGVSPVSRARAVADLFDRYCRHRPQMVRAWVERRWIDGSGAPLPGELSWQPEMFGLVAERVGLPTPPERLEAAVARLLDDDLDIDLPSRIAMFGMSTLPADVLSLLDAVSRHIDVRVLLLAPSLAAAGSLLSAARPATPSGPLLRREDRSVDVLRHPLLRSWGDVGREGIVALAAAGLAGTCGDVGDPPPAVPPRELSLLRRVQSDVRRDRTPDGTFDLRDDDRSVQVHSCVGDSRQVEVLRDAILHLLAADPTLTEGDVVVLCPRIEELAPVVEAVLGPSADGGAVAEDPAEPDRAPALRYRITDRRVRSDVPLLGVLGALLDMLPGRFSASSVADLLAMGPVRDRFGLSVEDLGLVDGWISGSNVRWGFDGAHRAAWGLPGDHLDNTWVAGIDQLMSGVAVRGGGLTESVGGVVPLDLADGSVPTAARFAEAVRTLGAVREEVVGRRATLDDWCRQITAVVDRLCSLAWSESWQRRRLDRVLAELRDSSIRPDGRRSTSELDLSDVRGLLAPRLGGEPARASVGTGAVTICSMSPLRSVPARVVCVLGFDEDALPSAPSLGDDLLVAAPMVGDRDQRSETRQMLLEALMSASDAFVVTHGSVDVRTNLPVPSAVLLDELWDLLCDTCDQDADGVRGRLRVEHPRHAFDARNFSTASPARPGGPLGGCAPAPWGFDPAARDGADALSHRRVQPAPEVLVPEPLPPPSTGVGSDVDIVSLDRLHRCVLDPVRAFVVERLGVHLPRRDEAQTDHLPVALEPLERHRLGTDLLAARAGGVDLDRWLHLESARGALPPAALGAAAVDQVVTGVARIERSAEDLGVGLTASDSHQIDLRLGDRRLVGVVDRCAGGDRPGPVRLSYSTAKLSHRIPAVIDLLALVATDPGRDWRAVLVNRTTRTSDDHADELLLVPVGDGPDDRRERSREALAQLIDLLDRAMIQPLPIFPSTSAHLARGERSKARSAWVGNPSFGGESSVQHVRLAFGELEFEEMLELSVDGRTPAEHARELWRILESAVTEEEPS